MNKEEIKTDDPQKNPLGSFCSVKALRKRPKGFFE